MLAKNEYFNWLNTHREAYKKPLLKRSKELGYLMPLSAFIVVEDDIQWKALEDKEKQMSNAHDALDHSDTPEPGLILPFFFAVCVICFELLRRRKKQICTNTGNDGVSGFPHVRKRNTKDAEYE